MVTYRWEDRFLTPSLRWIASVSSGVDQYPMKRLMDADVVVTSARGINAVPVAEHAMALLLACTRRIGQSTREAVRHAWVRRSSKMELQDSTLVVFGLGAIGEEIAKRAMAFGMDVIGIKRNPESYTGVVRDVRGPSQLVEACRSAEVLVSAVPGGPSTRHMIDADVIAALGRGIVVSVGRGSAVDESALLSALENRELLAAGMDVFAIEPLPPDSRLWDIPTVVLTPHIGGSGPRYGERWVELFERNLAALSGKAAWENRIGPANMTRRRGLG